MPVITKAIPTRSYYTAHWSHCDTPFVLRHVFGSATHFLFCDILLVLFPDIAHDLWYSRTAMMNRDSFQTAVHDARYFLTEEELEDSTRVSVSMAL